MVDRLPLRIGPGFGLVAGSVLALQVLLSRLLSAELFYHFCFLTISLARRQWLRVPHTRGNAEQPLRVLSGFPHPRALSCTIRAAVVDRRRITAHRAGPGPPPCSDYRTRCCLSADGCQRLVASTAAQRVGGPSLRCEGGGVPDRDSCCRPLLSRRSFVCPSPAVARAGDSPAARDGPGQ